MPLKTLNLDKGQLDIIETFFNENSEIQLVSLCTSDGFNIAAHSNLECRIEPDKLAAIASAVCSLGASCARQIISREPDITIVETNGGNLLLLQTNYMGLNCVLTVCCKQAMSLATARFLSKRLANALSSVVQVSATP